MAFLILMQIRQLHWFLALKQACWYLLSLAQVIYLLFYFWIYLDVGVCTVCADCFLKVFLTHVVSFYKFSWSLSFSIHPFFSLMSKSRVRNWMKIETFTFLSKLFFDHDRLGKLPTFRRIGCNLSIYHLLHHFMNKTPRHLDICLREILRVAHIINPFKAMTPDLQG